MIDDDRLKDEYNNDESAPKSIGDTIATISAIIMLIGVVGLLLWFLWKVVLPIMLGLVLFYLWLWAGAPTGKKTSTGKRKSYSRWNRRK